MYVQSFANDAQSDIYFFFSLFFFLFIRMHYSQVSFDILIYIPAQVWNAVQAFVSNLNWSV